MDILFAFCDEKTQRKLISFITDNFTEIRFECCSDAEGLKNTANRCNLAFVDIDNFPRFSSGALSEDMEDSACRVIYLSEKLESVWTIFQGRAPFGFLEKPVSTEKLGYFLQKLRNPIRKNKRYFSYREGRIQRQILFDEIIYVESQREKLIFNTQKGSFHLWMKIGDFEKEKPASFTRCHKSYIVNMRCVNRYEKNEITVVGGTMIPVSRSQKNRFEKSYADFLSVDLEK